MSIITKVMFLFVLTILIQGCGGMSSLLKVKDDSYYRYEKTIKSAIEKCYLSENGTNISKILSEKSTIQNTYDKYIVNEIYKETDKTYKDLKEECQAKYDKEQLRLKEVKAQKLLEEKNAREKAFKAKVLLAQSSGYKGYLEYRDIEDFLADAQNGLININDYKGYVIYFKSHGTYAYKFSQYVNGIDIYQPDYRYGLKSTLGIKRVKENTNHPLEGQPLKNIEYTSFIGIDSYSTVLGAKKQIIIFDRAVNFRMELFEYIMNKLEISPLN